MSPFDAMKATITLTYEMTMDSAATIILAKDQDAKLREWVKANPDAITEAIHCFNISNIKAAMGECLAEIKLKNHEQT